MFNVKNKYDAINKMVLVRLQYRLMSLTSALRDMPCVATSLKANCKGNDLLSSVLFALVTFCLFVLLLRLRYGSAEYCDERVCLSVCAFVCPRSYLRNYTSDLRQIPCACSLRLWLGPPLAA